jgi:murein DD-endopeptidase MepM/ murein hydrolase activator NlpD
LRAGSLRVTVGQRIKRGDVIAVVGNSGNSFRPHLHFQLQDASGLSAEGLPYRHESFEVLGRCQRLGSPCARAAAAVVSRNEIPLNGMIVQFPR